MKLLYKFIGSEEDRKKFVDPEPEFEREYTEEEFDKISDNNSFVISHYFSAKEVPDEPVNHLTPQMRLEIVKMVYPNLHHVSIRKIEDYINTGKHF